MARNTNRPKKGQKFLRGKYEPINPEKYKGTFPIEYRSSWELKFMKFCDLRDFVQTWGSESVVVQYIDPTRNNTKHRYFIDFNMTVKEASGNLQKYLIEIKPYHECLKPVKTKRMKEITFKNKAITFIRNQSKWKYATAFAKQKGYKFEVLTEKELF